MRFSDLPTPVRSLVRSIQQGEKEVTRLLEEMLTAPVQQRVLLRERVTRLVARLRDNAVGWANVNLPKVFKESALKTARSLETANVNVGDVADRAAFFEAQLRLVFLGRVDAALQSVSTLATRLVFAPDPLNVVDASSRNVYQRAINAGASVAEARSKALTNFRDKVVLRPAAVQGASGLTRQYALTYYLGMLGTNAVTQAVNIAPKFVAIGSGLDLVRVSPQPSKHGDFCDAYAGRVFSLSGTHPVFPSIALTPNGGPPYHPLCRHTLEVVLPGEDLSREIVTNARFLHNDPNVVARAWGRRS